MRPQWVKDYMIPLSLWHLTKHEWLVQFHLTHHEPVVTKRSICYAIQVDCISEVNLGFSLEMCVMYISVETDKNTPKTNKQNQSNKQKQSKIKTFFFDLTLDTYLLAIWKKVCQTISIAAAADLQTPSHLQSRHSDGRKVRYIFFQDSLV